MSMPGEPGADETEVLANQGMETTADPSLDGTQSDPILDALKQQPQDWQKRYNAIRPEFDKARTKANTLDSLLKNPKFSELAKADPAMAEALAKAGYQVAREQAEADGGEDYGPDGKYWTTPDGRMDIVEARTELRYEMEDFSMQSLGRRFTTQEAAEVKSWIAKAGALTVEQAWKLTASADKLRLAAEQKRMAQQPANRGNRPRPTPSPLGGGAEKLDMKKHPSQFNDAEKREFLNNLPQ